MAKRRNTQPVNYLSINKDGYLYKKSDETAYNEAKANNQDFIQKVTLKDGRVVYHEIFDGGTDDGYLDYLGIKEVEYSDGKQKQLVMVVKGDQESDMIMLPLFRSNGALNLYAKHIACILPNMDYSKRINIVPSTKKNDKGYTIQNVFINYVDEKDSFVQLAHKYGDKGDIPSSEIVKAVDGTEKRDFTKQDNYLYNILVEEIKRFKEFKGANTTPSNPTPVVTTTTVEEPVSSKVLEPIPVPVEEDDLPF